MSYRFFYMTHKYFTFNIYLILYYNFKLESMDYSNPNEIYSAPMLNSNQSNEDPTMSAGPSYSSPVNTEGGSLLSYEELYANTFVLPDQSMLIAYILFLHKHYRLFLKSKLFLLKHFMIERTMIEQLKKNA